MHQLLTLQSFQTAELLCGTFREFKMLCMPIFQSQSTTEGTQAAKGERITSAPHRAQFSSHV